MIRLPLPPLHCAAFIVPLALAFLGGCGSKPSHPDMDQEYSELVESVKEGSQSQASILEGVIKLIRTASDTPGGANFKIATDNLNQYFQIGTKDEDYRLSEGARLLFESLNTSPRDIGDLEVREWRLPDARHIEDCLLFQTIAGRVAGDGTTLERVQRLFDWTIKNIHLAPPGWQVPPGMEQAKLRPYDVAISGLAVEDGAWAERSWVFLSLCRQINVDAALLAVQPKGSDTAKTWACAAIADGKGYLFDLKMGLIFPGPDPNRPATFQEVIEDPSRLTALDLPDLPYPIRPEDLRDGQVIAWIDSSVGFMRPKMQLLQGRLYGDTRMILFRDPAEQVSAFVNVLGERCQQVGFWPLPREVERRLFTDPAFVRATQIQLAYFSGNLPTLAARVAQLRGDTSSAKTMYVNFRFADKVQVSGAKGAEQALDPASREILDAIATYMLGLCHLEAGDPENARLMFEQTLKMVSEPSRDEMSYHLYRWAALTNLARLAEAEGRLAEAIRDYSYPQATPEGAGNRIRAQRLIFADPMLKPAPDRPAAPPKPE